MSERGNPDDCFLRLLQRCQLNSSGAPVIRGDGFIPIK